MWRCRILWCRECVFRDMAREGAGGAGWGTGPVLSGEEGGGGWCGGQCIRKVQRGAPEGLITASGDRDAHTGTAVTRGMSLLTHLFTRTCSAEHGA